MMARHRALRNIPIGALVLLAFGSEHCILFSGGPSLDMVDDDAYVPPDEVRLWPKGAKGVVVGKRGCWLQLLVADSVGWVDSWWVLPA